MSVHLEHANLVVRDIDEAIRFLQTAFPEFRIRHDGRDSDGSRWVHIGTFETYIALTGARGELSAGHAPYSGAPGLNHLAYEVDDVDGVRGRLASAGYAESTVPNKHPYRKRVYFYDRDGNDWEFIQYLSDDPRERHDYSIPDK